ncbi:hypothetical protein MJG53_000887 [Ovis ammon polii x Ovis aries]|uniref:Uncharacterized protein n=1 Tax=Ovis ammon polii x Ovis aries TaxID=2918886 RepID=A0ACB9VJN7_9CETA|nr:hypothetical protein MJT46_000380 [Ovis ammon polii x Ovis aries]KAI4589838.1 hypothetical protein MJG53_000887 [Ovis ammon polii x Ovis aries]
MFIFTPFWKSASVVVKTQAFSNLKFFTSTLRIDTISTSIFGSKKGICLGDYLDLIFPSYFENPTGPNPKTTSKKGVEMGRKNGEKRKEEENKTKKVRPQRQERLPHLVRKSRNWKAEGKIIPGWLLVIRPKCHFIEEMVPETLSYHTISIISMTTFMLINQQLACYQKGDRHLRPVDTEPGIGGIRELRFFQVLVTLKNV